MTLLAEAGGQQLPELTVEFQQDVQQGGDVANDQEGTGHWDLAQPHHSGLEGDGLHGQQLPVTK